MICPTCSSENTPPGGACSTCGGPLASSEVVGSSTVDRRLMALARDLHAAGIGRGVVPAGAARRGGAHGAQLLEPPARAIEIGALQIAFGANPGARLELADGAAATADAPAAEPAGDAPAPSVRATAAAAVWELFAGGASIVRLRCAPGAGATTLLHELARAAHAHGFTGGAFVATGARGPAADAAQRIGALLAARRPARFFTGSEFARSFGSRRALLLFDRTTLRAADLAQLAATFPRACFVVADAFAADAATELTLGPLTSGDTGALLEAASGRRLDADNARVALALAATLGSLPGPTRLVGVAARELRRSFISLHVGFSDGAAVLRELVATLPAAERRVLGVLALARAPLADHHLAYVLRSAGIHRALEHLLACELIRPSGEARYELPRYVEALVPPAADAEALPRIIDVFCDVLDSAATAPLLDRQLSAAEFALQTAANRAQWGLVRDLGPRLAQAFALRGAFVAWGNVLDILQTAAGASADSAWLTVVRHDIGIRALAGGDDARAAIALHAAMRDRQAAGDETGAAAESALAALADRQLAAQPASGNADAPDEREHPTPAQSEPRAPLAPWKLALLGLGIVVLTSLGLSRYHRPAADPAIVRFSADPIKIASGESAQLCLAATNTTALEVFADTGPVGGGGAGCLTVRPVATTTYVAVGTAADGRQARRAVTVAVTERIAGPAITRFAAFPARIRAGQSTRLCYAVTGADELRIVPRVGNLMRLQACQTVTLRAPHRYRYVLAASDDAGHYATRQVQVDVVAARPAPHVARPRASVERAMLRTIFQFDATPGIVERGQAASLCVGVDRGARGFVTHIGSLPPGITRCYRVTPRATTVYRLYVAADRAATVKSIVVAVRR